MKEMVRVVVILTLFAVVSGVLLALTNKLTADPIASAKRAEKAEALRRVLPPCDNDLLGDAVELEKDGEKFMCYIARKEGDFAGVAVSSSAQGYGGGIEIIVGIRTDGKINAVEVVEAQAETPGLGAKIKDAVYLGQFRNRFAEESSWCRVRKDGGEIDAITGATISSRAVCEAVRKALALYVAQNQKMRVNQNKTEQTAE